jgi:pimeloyl-[acyl-carrier protein] methyl ester esterase
MDRQMQRHYEQSMGEFFRLMFEGEELSPERYRDIIRFAVRDGSLPSREISRAGLKLLGSTDLRHVLSAIKQPVLVHYGQLDLITVPAAGRFLAENIPGAREKVWDGVGHAPFLSRPQESVSLWLEFLQ